MFKDLKQPLAELVDSKYASAKASESLVFASSSLAILHTSSGLPFQLRYCPSLAKKPLPNKDSGVPSAPKKKTNPFENPDPALFITDVMLSDSSEPTHFLVLNKFPIIPSHFILATKINKAQTAVLEQADLAAAFECLKAWESSHDGRRLYGFFNSGSESGASQAHRHLQFVPIEGMRLGDEKGEWDVLMDKVIESNVSLPFQVYWEKLSAETSAEDIYAIYNRLHSRAHETVKRYVTENPGDLELVDDGSSSPFSYNLGMTSTALMIVPRRREGSVIRGRNGSEVGFAAFNGTLLAGTMMVKSEEEWALLKGDEEVLNVLLSVIGISSSIASSPKPGL